MATIEERARQYATNITGGLHLNGAEGDVWNAAFNRYVAIATEQHKIDIEKACEVYRKELSEIISIFNHMGKELYGINELGELISLEGCIKDFRKTMEE